jgi:hypothetical protein
MMEKKIKRDPENIRSSQTNGEKKDYYHSKEIQNNVV